MNNFLCKNLQGVIPYKASSSKESICLDANENTMPTLYALREYMAKWMLEAPIHRYPDSDTTKLNEAIAMAYDVSKEQVVCGVGSDQLIDCLLRSVLDPQDLVLAPSPSFSMYQLATHLNFGRFITIPLAKDFTYHFTSLYEAIRTYQPKVTFLCNPNNPTGCILSLSKIEEILKITEGIVVVDEAYIEFGGETAIPLLKQYKNLFILRTFSKAYGLAGARVGYGIGDGRLIQTILTAKPPYHLNSFSQEIATWVIAHQELFYPMIEAIKGQRDYIYETLKSYDYEVYPSYGNFLWMKGCYEIERRLEEVSIRIKTFKHQDSLYYRITVGTEGENQKLLEIFKEVYDERGKDQ